MLLCATSSVLDTTLAGSTPKSPPWPLGQISAHLVSNIQVALRTCSREPAVFFPTIKLAIKVSRFLFDASEYSSAFIAAYTAFQAARAVSEGNPDLETTSIHWEYETLCV